MKKQMKGLLAVGIAVTLLASSMCSVYADSVGHINKGQLKKMQTLSNRFNDVAEDFWGCQAIYDLAQRGIIGGYSDHTFRPNSRVTRAEFATMLTKTLNLTTSDTTQIFADVPSTAWYFKSVEAVKNDLTGYQTSDGTMYFYGNKDAVREDMAVALVKALNIAVVPNNGALAQIYSDYNKISPALMDYVYAAYTNGLMQGSNGKFNPQSTLTRAQAAALLENALKKTNKVVVGNDNSNDAQKVVVSNSNNTTAILSNLTYNGISVPGFAAGVFTYNIALPAGTMTLPVVTAASSIQGTAANVTQAAGLPGTAVVVVTSADGTARNVYTINFSVAPAASTDATVSTLTYNGITVPGFASNVSNYNVVLPAGTTTVPLMAAVANTTGATVSITQAAGLPGTAAIVVTAADGITKRIYTINFTVAASSSTNASLSTLTYNGILVPGFSPNTFTYNVVLPAGTTVFPVVAAAVSDTTGATTSITGSTGLPGTSIVVVTAADRTTRSVYVINFTVAAQ